MGDKLFEQLFSFGGDEMSQHFGTAIPVVGFAPGTEDVVKALHSAEIATYKWTIASDEIAWSDNTNAILNCPLPAVATGKLFASHLDADNFTTRYETIMNTKERDFGDGVAYRIEYLFRSEGSNGEKSVWVEDQGRWYAGADGSPHVAHGTVRRVDERHTRDQQLNFLGNCDPLTGMMNRGRMTEALGEAITVTNRERRHCAFAIAAVNNLPVVNEAYGFDVADEVIVALGRRLRQVMRGGDGIARYSGGKFGIILNECNELELRSALDRFLGAVRDSVIETRHGPVWAMLSIGAICLPDNAPDAHTATARAEEALSEARKLPSDGFVIYKPSERRQHERALNARCATEIVQCLKDERFKLAFQPIISVKTGQVEMHEALLRMADAVSGELITAAHLVPVSENLGLVRLIDRSVLQMIVQDLNTYPDAKLAMNVSGITATDPRWHEQMLEVLAANAQSAKRLIIEITETVALSDVPTTRRFVEKLRNLGCGVAIDDFGAGFTSFRNLRDLPVNMIKLDGEFCQNLRNNSENEYIVRSLIELAGKFKMTTVAEWVQNSEDAQALRNWGVDFLQGNLFGEASIEVPWVKANNAAFSLDESPTFKIQENPIVVTSSNSALPLAEDVGAETSEAGAPKPNINTAPSLADQHQSLPIASAEVSHEASKLKLLDFDSIDSSILNLRSTLDELSQLFPEKTDETEHERDAA